MTHDALQMTAVVTQIRAVQHDKKNKYEYDSDEDTEGGTWEHKLRTAEMQTTKGCFVVIAAPDRESTLFKEMFCTCKCVSLA